MKFEKLDIKDLSCNPVTMFSENWALLGVKNGEKFNAMTVSWGATGGLWGKDVCICFVRPQRYTFEFMENSEYFSVAFFSGYKKELAVFGSKSGRDCDKFAETGFVPVHDGDWVYPEQADTVFLCRKIAFQDMSAEGFIADDIKDNYSAGDYHRTYVGEIISVKKKV